MNEVHVINKKKTLLAVDDDMIRMNIEIWLYRSDYLITNALKRDIDSLDTILHNNQFDLVIIQINPHESSLQKFLLMLLKHTVKILFITENNNRMKKITTNSNLVQTINCPFEYHTLLTTIHKLCKI